MHIEHLSIGYGTRTLLSDVTLTLEGGQLVALLGRNGTGKSTLLRALAGLEPCHTGEVWLDGRPLSTLDAGERSRRVSLVTTEKVAVPHLRVHELVAMGRAPYTNWVGRLSAADEAAIARALELTGMSAYASRPTDSLSDGESQRVMIARALAQDTPLVLLDEPTSFLDLPNRYDLCLLLKRHRKIQIQTQKRLQIKPDHIPKRLSAHQPHAGSDSVCKNRQKQKLPAKSVPEPQAEPSEFQLSQKFFHINRCIHPAAV